MKNKWPVKKLGEILIFVQNGINPKQGETGNFPISRIETIQNESFDAKRVKYANLNKDEFERYKYEVGDIAFSHINSYEKLGKVAIYDGEIKNLVHGVNLLRLKTIESLCIPEYLFAYMQTPNFRSQIDPYINKAVNQASINQTSLKKTLIPIPPTNIQKQIIEKLDAIRSVQELIDLQIQKTEELFKSLLSEIFNSYKKQLKPLGEICTFLGGGTPSKKNASYYKGLIPWITIKDMRENEIYDSIDHVTTDAIKESAANFVSENTLLVATRVGLGKVAITRVGACFNQDIKALIPKTETIPEYLLFSMIHVSPQIVSKGVGGTVKGVNLGMLKKLQIPLPSILIQKEIVAKLNAIQEYKKLLQKQKQLYKELFDSVLYKSMKGEVD